MSRVMSLHIFICLNIYYQDQKQYEGKGMESKGSLGICRASQEDLLAHLSHSGDLLLCLSF